MKKFVGFLLFSIAVLSMSTFAFADILEYESDCLWHSIMWQVFGEKDNAEELIAERLQLHGGTVPPLIELTPLPMCTEYMRETIAAHERNVARGIVDETVARYSRRFIDALERGETIYIATTHLCLSGHMIDSVALAEYKNSATTLESTIVPHSNFATRFVQITALMFASGVDWRMTNTQTLSSTHISVSATLLNSGGGVIDFDFFDSTLSPRGFHSDTRMAQLFGRPWWWAILDIFSTSGSQSCSGLFAVRF